MNGAAKKQDTIEKNNSQNPFAYIPFVKYQNGPRMKAIQSQPAVFEPFVISTPYDFFCRTRSSAVGGEHSESAICWNRWLGGLMTLRSRWGAGAVTRRTWPPYRLPRGRQRCRITRPNPPILSLGSWSAVNDSEIPYLILNLHISFRHTVGAA